jgi:hypothetical protein
LGLVAAVAAIAGAAIGGCASYLGTVKTQNAENDRVEKRIDREATGAARVLTSELIQAQTPLTTVLGKRCGHFTPESRIRISPGDLKLVEARLSDSEYNKLGFALDDFTEVLSNPTKARRTDYAALFDALDRAIVAVSGAAGAKNAPAIAIRRERQALGGLSVQRACAR